MSALGRANEQARRRAQAAGHATYSHQVVEAWPACTTCNVPIRYAAQAERSGSWRKCGCPDVLWHCSVVDGWQRIDSTQSEEMA